MEYVLDPTLALLTWLGTKQQFGQVPGHLGMVSGCTELHRIELQTVVVNSAVGPDKAWKGLVLGHVGVSEAAHAKDRDRDKYGLVKVLGETALLREGDAPQYLAHGFQRPHIFSCQSLVAVVVGLHNR